MATTSGQEGTQSLKVVRTACEIMEILTEVEEIGVTELADHLDIPKTTAHSYLRSLSNCGLARNNGGRYSASLKILEQAGRVRNEMGLYKSAKSKIDKLARETSEVVNLGVHENGKRVIVYVSEGENAIWDDSPIGDRTFIHQTAIGKSILAHLPEEQIQDIIDTQGLPPATDYTITDEDELSEELRDIRKQGYSIEEQEHQIGVSAIGVPIRARNDSVIGAVAVAGPVSRFSHTDVKENTKEELIECANVIELQYKHYK